MKLFWNIARFIELVVGESVVDGGPVGGSGVGGRWIGEGPVGGSLVGGSVVGGRLSVVGGFVIRLFIQEFRPVIYEL